MMKCKKTKKEIFGFDGEVDVEISFNNINNIDTACHFFKFTNITFVVEDGVINIEETFTDEVMDTYLSTEKFPNLSVRVLSPYISDLMSPDIKSDKIILKQDNSSFWNGGGWANTSSNPEDEDYYDENLIAIYKSLSVASNDNMYDRLRDNMYDQFFLKTFLVNYPETKEITFYEIILKATLGKYRGYMKLDFKEIKNTSDLVKVIESRLYEDQEYEWSEHPPFNNSSPSIYDNGIQAIEKRSSFCSDQAAAYLKDMCYLLNNKRIEELGELFVKASSELSISDFDKAVKWYCAKKGYATFKELIEKEFKTDELKSVGQKILESLSNGIR